MKKKSTIIISVTIVLILLLIIGISMKKSDIEILKSEKSYLEMLVRNQKLEKVDKVLKRTKTKEKRYQGIEKAYKNYYSDYINNIKNIQEQISKATSKYFINYEALEKGEEAQTGIILLIDRERIKIDNIIDKYKLLNKKEEMLKYAKDQGLNEEDQKQYYEMVGGDSEVKEDDTVLKKLILTKENYKMQENIIKYIIQQKGNYTVNSIDKVVTFKDEDKKAEYKNLETVIDYNINEILLNNKTISKIMDNLKSTATNNINQNSTN